MIKILSLTNVKGHLVKAELDTGKTVFIERDYAAEIGLEAGGTVDDIEAVLYESDHRRAKSRALWFLDRSDRTERSLIEKVVAGGISKQAATAAVRRLKELGLVDDRRYAENMYLRLMGQNVSKRAAYEKMYQKGVPTDIIKEVLSENGVDEVSQILSVIEKKYRLKLEQENGVQKTVAALMRRGFSYSAIRDAMKKYQTELEFEE